MYDIKINHTPSGKAIIYVHDFNSCPFCIGTTSGTVLCTLCQELCAVYGGYRAECPMIRNEKILVVNEIK